MKSTGAVATYRSGDWSLPSAVADPTGGAQVDTQARVAISSILTALRAYGLIAG